MGRPLREPAETLIAASKTDETVSPSPVSGARTGEAEPTRIGFRYGAVVVSHLVLDMYPMFIVALAVALQDTLALTDGQRATLVALNPVLSGASQPLFAWIGDRLNTRVFAPLGLIVGACAISAIGFAQSYTQLIALQVVGMIGVGIYHPISAALAGHTGAKALRRYGFVRAPRATGLSIFFMAGMLGGFLGPILSTRINEATSSMRGIVFLAIPGVLTGLVVWILSRRIEHADKKPDPGGEIGGDDAALDRVKGRWRCVWVLFASNTLRYMSNITLYFLFGAWARAEFADSAYASSRTGDLIAATTVGMAAANILLWFLPRGAERRMVVATGLAAAPCIALLPFVPFPGMLLCTGLAAVAYFMAIPSSIGLAHRLLPHATGLTGSLLMGLGWVVSASGPKIAERIVEFSERGVTLAFLFVACLLAGSGLAGFLLDRDLVRASADTDV